MRPIAEDNPARTPEPASHAARGGDSGGGGERPRIVYHRTRVGPWLHLRDLAGWEWNQVELTLPSLAPALDGLRIVHLSDLHLRHRWPRQLDELIERVNANPPDLILFTGDFVDDKRDHTPALPLVNRLISSLRARHGMFAILGNHDTDLLAPQLIRFGVPVIVHQQVEVSIRGSDGAEEAGAKEAGAGEAGAGGEDLGGARGARGGGIVELIGLPGPERGDLDEHFLRALPPKRAGVPRIVLAHYPDLIRPTLRAGAAPDLYLAGHTHGGQICLPGGCAIIRHDSLPRPMCKGAHDVEGTCLVVSRGFGFTTLPVRIFCPAEAVEVTLRRSQNAEW